MARQQVVIDVSGGVVQAVFTDADVTVILVDWDNISAGDAGTVYPKSALSEMPESTSDQVTLAIDEDDELIPDRSDSRTWQIRTTDDCSDGYVWWVNASTADAAEAYVRRLGLRRVPSCVPRVLCEKITTEAEGLDAVVDSIGKPLWESPRAVNTRLAWLDR